MYALSISSSRLTIILLLGLVMAATRFHHLGSTISLPDTSLAVFFLAGFYLRPWLLLAAFLTEAAVIDYLAIAYDGVSDWCVSPAYFFLIPTYASIWFAGRRYASRHQQAWRSLIPLLTAIVVGTTMAFLISNASFYLFSGRFSEMSLLEYATRVAKYFPPYALNTFLYMLCAAVVHTVVTTIFAHRAGHSASDIAK